MNQNEIMAPFLATGFLMPYFIALANKGEQKILTSLY